MSSVTTAQDAFTADTLPAPTDVGPATAARDGLHTIGGDLLAPKAKEAVPGRRPNNTGYDAAHGNPPECCGKNHRPFWPNLSAAGRPKGIPNKATRFMQEMARGILESEEYRESIIRRIKNDDLAPAVEVALMHYGYGKPVDKLVLKDDRSKLGNTAIDVDAEVLATELADLGRKARAERLKQNREADEDLDAELKLLGGSE